MTNRRSASDTAALAHALRAAGQAAAVAQMIRTGSAFDSVVQQLLATRGSLDSLLVRLVECELSGLQAPVEGTEPQVARVLRVAFDRAHRMPHSSRSPAVPPTIEGTTS